MAATGHWHNGHWHEWHWHDWHWVRVPIDLGPEYQELSLPVHPTFESEAAMNETLNFDWEFEVSESVEVAVAMQLRYEFAWEFENAKECEITLAIHPEVGLTLER